jgi:hypothetical protein
MTQQPDHKPSLGGIRWRRVVVLSLLGGLGCALAVLAAGLASMLIFGPALP